VQQGNEKHTIELLVEQFKHFISEIKFSKREKLVSLHGKTASNKSRSAINAKRK